MPYCDPTNVPFVVAERQRLKPRSVIDVGCGMGLCCDVIEHFRKDTGRRLLDALLDSCHTVVLTTPISFWDDAGIVPEQNVHQRHLSLWGEDDFAGTGREAGRVGLDLCRRGLAASARSRPTHGHDMNGIAAR